MNSILSSFWWIAPEQWQYALLMVQVLTGSGNDLVPSGTKPLPKPMLTQFYVANVDSDLDHHMISQGHNWLMQRLSFASLLSYT